MGLTDRIFTRLASRESAAAPQSTFMIDLSQVAAMLRLSTERCAARLHWRDGGGWLLDIANSAEGEQAGMRRSFCFWRVASCAVALACCRAWASCSGPCGHHAPPCCTLYCKALRIW